MSVRQSCFLVFQHWHKTFNYLYCMTKTNHYSKHRTIPVITIPTSRLNGWIGASQFASPTPWTTNTVKTFNYLYLYWMTKINQSVNVICKETFPLQHVLHQDLVEINVYLVFLLPRALSQNTELFILHDEIRSIFVENKYFSYNNY